MSGTTPSTVWKQKGLPQRYRPVCTSSKITRQLLASASSRTCFRYSSLSGHTPLSPWMGSIMIAHTSGPMAASSAAQSLACTARKPTGSGWKGSWSQSCAVAASVSMVRPWKLPLSVMTVWHSGPLCSMAQRRAAFIAHSLASAPELAKNVFQPYSSPARRQISWATSPRFSA